MIGTMAMLMGILTRKREIFGGSYFQTKNTGSQRVLGEGMDEPQHWLSNAEWSALKLYTHRQYEWTQQAAFTCLCTCRCTHICIQIGYQLVSVLSMGRDGGRVPGSGWSEKRDGGSYVILFQLNSYSILILKILSKIPYMPGMWSSTKLLPDSAIYALMSDSFKNLHC